MSIDDLSQLSMQELFGVEAGLLALERDPGAADQLEGCMRAAHSLKGAARIVDLSSGVGVAHAMENCFVAAQQGRLRLGQRHIDLLLDGVDLLGRVAKTTEDDRGQGAERDKPEIDAFLLALSLALQTAEEAAPIHDAASPAAALDGTRAVEPVAARETEDRVLRVTAENLNRLLGLAGESLVASRWLKPFADSLLRLKRQQHDSAQRLDALRAALSAHSLDERAQTALDEVRCRVLEGEQLLAQWLIDLEMFDRRSADLSNRLYDKAVACRMRPFADGVQAFPRMVRDLGRSLGKQVTLEIFGETTQVDRDVLEKLDPPLGHLLRNAVTAWNLRRSAATLASPQRVW